MKIKLFQFNMFPVNTYVLTDEETREAVIIDAGCYYTDEQQELKNYIVDNHLQLVHLLNTHLHLDHIFGNAFIGREFGIRPEAHANDEFLLPLASRHCNMFGFNINEEPASLGSYLQEGDVVQFGQSKLEVITTPGHSPGGITFYNKQDGCLFCGDTLFRGGMGRTDLDGGNYSQLIDSITNKLFQLPGETIVYPGHGPSTTLENEKRNIC